MISSDTFRGYNDLFILLVLAQGDSYGYEIGKQISLLSKDTYTMKETTLYTAFNRLLKTGYIDDYPGTETNGRKRTYYRLTEAGKEALKEKIEEWKLTKKVVNQIIKGASKWI